MNEAQSKQISMSAGIIERACDYSILVTKYADGTARVAVVNASVDLPAEERKYLFSSFDDAVKAIEIAGHMAMRAKAVYENDYT